MSKHHPFPFLGSLIVIAVLGNGCLCIDVPPDKPPPPKKTEQDKVNDCLDSCSTSRWSCQYNCNKEPECTRACVGSYDKCMDVCSGKKM